MAEDKRYTVTLDAYLYARNDTEAKIKAAKLAEFLRTLEDNDAQIMDVSFDSRVVHEGRLNIFENKLI